ncbi:methionine--tRNA ligase [Mycoplasmopsis felifaucium]|uniref:Methionine--tRNA ligase n=1 Tax=Mycoplasmopsis felifaucium TaxID=35768 RepID=A0ABZ2RVU1_9BACT
MTKKTKTFYITTPIYYASGPLHIGHLYCTTVAWTIRNYKKIMGYDTKFLTGSDEHGQKIEQKASKANIDPLTFVNELVETYKQMWEKWNIDYDFFSRTTDEKHIKMVQKVFSWFLEHGFIYKDKYEGLYSVEDEEFLTKNQAIKKEDGEYYHPSSGHKLVIMSEESYFFRISEMQNWWMKRVHNNPEWLMPSKMTKEMIQNFVSDGLEDLSVTRTNISWGIPTNEDPKHVLYVWLDALFNYVSALDYDIDNPGENYLKYWQNGDEIVHIIGKEIARFHFIYWTMFAEALGIKQPTHIFAHGLLRDKDGRKMSKSLNNVISPEYLLEKYHNEMIKYYFMAHTSLGEDSNFSEEKLIDVINADLINNYGNLVSRTLKMINNSFPNGLIYNVRSEKIHNDIDNEIIEFSNKFTALMDDFKIDQALNYAISFSSTLNKYIDETTPWKLADNLEDLSAILSRLLNGIYAISWALQIVMPEKISSVAKVLNIESFEIEKITDFNKFDNHIVNDKFILYNRIKK